MERQINTQQPIEKQQELSPLQALLELPAKPEPQVLDALLDAPFKPDAAGCPDHIPCDDSKRRKPLMSHIKCVCCPCGHWPGCSGYILMPDGTKLHKGYGISA